MKIHSIGSNYSKPKNYSRKTYVCSCLCPVFNIDGELLDSVMVKYDVDPNKDGFLPEPSKKKYWYTPQHWGEFKSVVELPTVFSKMNEEDFIVNTSFFTRDRLLMPYICNIQIKNTEKYNILKIKEQRKNKISKIKNL